MKDSTISFELGKIDGWQAFKTRRRGMHIYGLYSGTAVELRTMATGIEGSSTHSAEAAGSRVAVHGTVGLVVSVRIGGNGIARCATIVQMGSIIHARDAEAFRNHVTYDMQDLGAPLGAKPRRITWSNQLN